MRIRTSLPKKIVDKGIHFVLSSVTISEEFPEEIKRLKSINKKYRLVKVLAKNLRGKLDIHNKPYEPNTFLFVEQQKYDVLSPDGFSIHHSDTYDSPEAAQTALDKWVKRYEQQGYYSSNNGRIPLSEVKDYCQIVPV